MGNIRLYFHFLCFHKVYNLYLSQYFVLFYQGFSAPLTHTFLGSQKSTGAIDVRCIGSDVIAGEGVVCRIPPMTFQQYFVTTMGAYGIPQHVFMGGGISEMYKHFIPPLQTRPNYTSLNSGG